ncbi:MAG TPA: class I SAM-dependent methyltransferase [Longimicrobium sp.]|nr:class I SAM-dependent methyltransferase [Longimicrobium sp.]
MLYDDQAAHFDERAGLPPHAADAVARALAELAAPVDGRTLLEIGAGTGSLSLALLRLPIRYAGFDGSAAMLDVFRARAVEAGLAPALHVADGNGVWPAENRSVDLVFAARSLHHLEIDHVIAETRRVLRRPCGWLAIGRVRRPQHSPKSLLRRRMRRLLEAEGFAGRSGERHADELFAALEWWGGERLPVRETARWTVPHAPADSLAAWAGKAGLAGIDLPAEVKARVLADLESWAAAEFGDLRRPLEQEEWFEIAAAKVSID